MSQKILRTNDNLVPLMSSSSAEWYTPPEIVGKVIEVMGEIDLDPCSNPEPRNIPARNVFTAEDDGLKQGWAGRVYLNPPYGRGIGKWVNKLIHEAESDYDPYVTEAIALLPARVDTQWFRPLFMYPICFISGRLKFSGHKNSAPFPSALIYIGRNKQKFYDVCGELGEIVERVPPLSRLARLL